jgi:NAD(P)-dependent dehydrogenase (short-subunit alcohol dehydrogenase family)
MTGIVGDAVVSAACNVRSSSPAARADWALLSRAAAAQARVPACPCSTSTGRREDVARAIDVMRHRVDLRHASIQESLDARGWPDVLVNKPACALSARSSTRGDDWRDVVEINLTGTFLLSQTRGAPLDLRHFRAIVNITSMNGVAPGPNGVPRLEQGGDRVADAADGDRMGGHGIRVNAVAPPASSMRVCPKRSTPIRYRQP